MPATNETELREADQAIESLRRTLTYGLSDVQTARALLRTVLKREWWKDRIINVTDRRQQYREFMRFVSEPPVEGLGTTIETLDVLADGDTELQDELDKVRKQPPGAPEGNKNASKITDNNVNNCFEYDRNSPVGNSSAAALRRLRKDRPDLHSRVLAGELSPHGAAIEAGFRKRTIQIPEDLDGAAAALRRRLNDDELRQLVALLTEYL